MFAHISFILALGQSTALPPNGDFAHFFEGLAKAQTAVRIDETRLIQGNHDKSAKSELLKDLKDAHSYTSASCIASLSQNPSIPEGFIEKLQQLGVDQMHYRALVTEPNGVSPALERRAWRATETAFRSVVVSALQVTGFSLQKISPPIAYNLAPVLYEGVEGTILANADAPERLRVGKCFTDGKSAIQEGDEIVAYKDPDEQDWIPVRTWRDLLHMPEDAEGDKKTQLLLRVKRKGKVHEVAVGFVASIIFEE